MGKDGNTDTDIEDSTDMTLRDFNEDSEMTLKDLLGKSWERFFIQTDSRCETRLYLVLVAVIGAVTWSSFSEYVLRININSKNLRFEILWREEDSVADWQSATVDAYSSRRNIWFENESSSRHNIPYQMSSPFNLQFKTVDGHE